MGDGWDVRSDGAGVARVGESFPPSQVCIGLREVLGEVGGWLVRQETVLLICFVTYNIQISHNGGLEFTLRGMSQANVNLRVFQETKFTKVIYMQESSGDRVVASEARSAHNSGVDVLF